MVVRIGLTGGIAAGKSTVSARLKELGALVIDYDQLAREVVQPGTSGLQAIAEAFGPESLNADGTLNRAWMAEQVFSSKAKANARERLDAIEHPLINDLAIKAEQDNASANQPKQIIVHDIPLLAEVIDTMPFDFNHIVTVEAPESVRIDRMMHERGLSKAQAEARIATQSTETERKRIADIVIDAAQPKATMLSEVDDLYANWLSEAK